MAKEVMKTHDLDFCSRPDNHASRRLSYNGLDLVFAPYEMRKLCVVNLFSRVQQFRPIQEDEVGRLMEKICQLSGDSKPVNISEATTCLSITIICRVGFGKRYAEAGAKRSRFHGLLSESQALLSSFCFSDYFPWVGWIDSRGFTIVLKTLSNNLISSIKNSSMNISIQTDSCYYRYGRMVNVFLAGTETSAAAMTWAMSFLMKHSNCLKTSQDEVRNLVGRKGFLNENDIQSLTYLKAVIKETFRLQPIAPLLVARETLGKCSIGTALPERFIGSSIDYKGLHFELIPFGAGRRICPGMRMGVATVELALANLLYKFDWEMPAGMTEEDIDFDALGHCTQENSSYPCG
ncbi:hypothetical protein V6N11_044808 [Hibiscus sabdariffa]|uniref:Cytochrome P450 n=1 Tax=Hibiscus sabdariffa TaxID=183260 RepID=A0ABR2PTY0_9ROSI